MMTVDTIAAIAAVFGLGIAIYSFFCGRRFEKEEEAQRAQAAQTEQDAQAAQETQATEETQETSGDTL